MGIGHNTISAGIYDALHLQPSLSTLDAHLQVSWWLRRRRSEDPRNLEEFGTLGPFPYQNFVFLCVFDSFFIYLGQVQYQLTPGNVMILQQSPMAGFKLNHLLKHSEKIHRTNSRWFARLRFFRMVRLVRLLRYMPEVIILVKGLGVASRCQAASSVSCELWWGYLFFFWEVDIAAIAYILQLVIPIVTNSR